MSRHEDSDRSKILPADQFEIALNDLIGVPNGAHTAPTLIQSRDFYGNATQFIVQTVRHDGGKTAFVTLVNSSGALRFILPPDVLRLIERQTSSLTTMVRRRHGKRLAEQRMAEGTMPIFTPEMRAKALKTRKANAATRKARAKK